MNNGDRPAAPVTTPEVIYLGLTKREQFCLTMGVPKTGDDELDAIIIEGNRIKLAGIAMQGLLGNGKLASEVKLSDVAIESVHFANALLKALEETK